MCVRIMVLGALLAAACDGEDTREATAGLVGSLVEQTKGVAEGISEGANRGRENAEGANGERTIFRAEDVHAQVEFEVLEVRAAPGEATEVEIAFSNDAETALHVTGLREEGNVLLLDEDDFAVALSLQSDTVEIPAQARTRVTLRFGTTPDKAHKLRLWGEEMELPEPTAAAEEGSE